MNTSTVRNVVAAVALISALAVPATVAAVRVTAVQQATVSRAMAFEFCIPLPGGFSVCVRFAGAAADAQ